MANKLTPAQEEQIRVMRKDGKSPEDVAAFFKGTYSIDLPLWKVHYIVGKGRLGGVASDEKPRRLKAQRKYASKDNEEDIVAIAKEIVALPKQIEEIYLKIFKQLRGDLIKAKGRAQDILGENES